MSRLIYKSIAVALLAAGSLSAHATFLSVGGDLAPGDLTGSVYLNGTTYSGSMGGMSISWNWGASVAAYCIEPQQGVEEHSFYNDYTAYTGLAYLGNATTNKNLEKLFSEENVVNTGMEQAAFAMAVWEIGWEKSGVYNVNSGTISFGSGQVQNSGALQLAQTWLNELPYVVDDYTITVLSSPNEQDLVYGVKNPVVTPPISSAVPEPGTYAMMAVGLVGIGVFSGRRDRKRS